MFAGVLVVLRCPAALAPVHPAPRLAVYGWGSALRPLAGPGSAARGLCQARRFRLHGVVRLNVHFLAPRNDGGIERRSPPAHLRLAQKHADLAILDPPRRARVLP